MRAKRITILIVLIILGIIIVPILLYYFGDHIPTQRYIYELNWDIDIPSDYKPIYQRQDKHDFQGKGHRYTIFTSKTIDKSNLITLQKDTKETQVYSGNSSDSINYDIEKFVLTVASDLNISESSEPKFKEYYLWQEFIKYGGKLVILYFPNSDNVFFIEKLV